MYQFGNNCTVNQWEIPLDFGFFTSKTALCHNGEHVIVKYCPINVPAGQELSCQQSYS